MNKSEMISKRLFDVICALLGLFFLWPLVIICWLFASIETRSNGFFLQNRVGRNGKLFKTIKIKTMLPIKIGEDRSTVTVSGNSKITFSGRLFRRYKLDELPQLFNVLIGEMSFVGPRPDVPGYADMLDNCDRVILTVRPGITGPASLKYKNEEEILAEQLNPKEYNDKVIWPDKVAINKDYIKYYSFIKDIEYIMQTIRG